MKIPLCGSGGVLVQIPREVPEVPVQIPEVPGSFPVQVLGEVPEGYGADASLGCSEDAW